MVFHLAAQSSVSKSFSDPLGTMQTNCIGTNNLLEAVRNGTCDPVVVFAGSSDEYRLVVSSPLQYELLKKQYGIIFPEPKIPEVPISETNPLRPMSPYAVSKVFGDHLTRKLFSIVMGLDGRFTLSQPRRRRPSGFLVTAVIAKQVAQLFQQRNKVPFHVEMSMHSGTGPYIDDVIRGYCILATKGVYGDVYTPRHNEDHICVLSYFLMSLETAGSPGAADRGVERWESD